MSTAKVFTVFLASPSDVLDERDAAERVVSKINQKLAMLGWMVRLVRWENVRRGLGAPQRRINPALDECDLLVGVVHLAWGTATEEYSSGFEEEFERVRRRHEEGEAVDAVLFLREVREGEAADEATLAFRERAKALAFLYQYLTIEEFEGRLFEHLTEEVVRRAAPELHVAEPGQGRKELPPGPEASRELGSEQQQQLAVRAQDSGDEADAQAASALHVLGEHVSRESEPPSEKQVVRAHLAATAVLSQRVSESTLDSHQANALYRYREDFDLAWLERRLLCRTMCEDGLLIPGWRMLPRERGITDLLIAALTDSSVSVRRGALRELGAEGLRDAAQEIVRPVEALDVIDVYIRLAGDDDSGVRDTVAAFLPASQLEETDLLLGLIAARGGGQASRILLERLISSDPSAACRLASDAPTSLKPDVQRQLVSRARDIDDLAVEELEASGRAGWSLAMRIRVRSGRVDDSIVRALDDDKLAVRSAALAALIEVDARLSPGFIAHVLRSDDGRSGWPSGFLEREDLLLRALEVQSVASLLEYVDWLSPKTAVALHAAARRPDGAEAVARARAILGDGLEQEREKAIERYVARGREPEEARKAAHHLAEEFRDYFDAELLTAALNAVSERHDPDVDADLARPYIDGDYWVPDAATRVLALCGDAKDLNVLVRRSERVFRIDVAQLLTGALHAAAENVDEVIRIIRDEIESPATQIAALLKLARANGLRVREETLLELLYDDDDQVRLAAVRLLVTMCDAEHLVAVLERYVDSDRYRYYNVIGVLDRVLFGPAPVASQAMGE